MENKYLISKCLLGVPCRFDGQERINEGTATFKALLDSGSIAVCPEESGGLPTPRPPAEIQGGTGEEVLEGKSKIVNIDGRDVTSEYLLGAKEILETAQQSEIKMAILKSRSPACGVEQIYDGSFNGRLKKGRGIAAALLIKNNIKVISDEHFIKLNNKIKSNRF